VVRTNIDTKALDATAAVKAYKELSNAERAFRSLKTVDIEVRPIHHRLGHRVRAHVLLCMLAYYLEWHMRQVLKPIFFDDHDKSAAEATRDSIVVKAHRSKAASRKAASKRTVDDLPVESFRSLLANLATITHNTMAMADHRPPPSSCIHSSHGCRRGRSKSFRFLSGCSQSNFSILQTRSATCAKSRGQLPLS